MGLRRTIAVLGVTSGKIMPKPEIVAVYGTLKKEQHNHYMLLTSNFIGEAAIPGYLWTRPHEKFPRACADSESPVVIQVELYKVSPKMMQQMARLETPYGYYMQTVTTTDGVNALMWASVEGPDPDCNISKNGKWE